MTVVDLEELAEMAVQLESTARKLAPSPERYELLRDVARFRAQLATRLSELKAKKK
ncbi:MULTISPECIES: hypothetical protein [Bradyrhizobium]|uniref:50S ribosomal protein L29 n=1 Tax=Bradyrhizobium septentrionale TaxID=1404411 RepID=A0ABZ2P2B7_9BRAD